MRAQPFGKEFADFKRQPQQDVTGIARPCVTFTRHAGFRGSTYPGRVRRGSRPFPVYLTQATLAIRETSGYHSA